MTDKKWPSPKPIDRTNIPDDYGRSEGVSWDDVRKDIDTRMYRSKPLTDEEIDEILAEHRGPRDACDDIFIQGDGGIIPLGSVDLGHDRVPLMVDPPKGYHRPLTQEELRQGVKGFAEGLEEGKRRALPLYIAGTIIGLLCGIAIGMVLGSSMAHAGAKEDIAMLMSLDSLSTIVNHPGIAINEREETWFECTDTPVRISGEVIFNIVHYLPKMPNPKPYSLHCEERHGTLDDTMLGVWE